MILSEESIVKESIEKEMDSLQSNWKRKQIS
jgi:hypothetical protein